MLRSAPQRQRGAAPRPGHLPRNTFHTRSRNRQRQLVLAIRFSASVVFRAFTLFPTFSFYGDSRKGRAGSRKPAGYRERLKMRRKPAFFRVLRWI